MEICKEFTFEASHILPNHKGKCGNLHGHSWRLIVYIRGPINQETGMVDDFYNIKQAVQPIVDELDHAHLGAWQTDKLAIVCPEVRDHLANGHYGTKSVPWLQTDNPTSENLLVEIAKQLVKRGLVFSQLALHETATTGVCMSWQEFNALRR